MRKLFLFHITLAALCANAQQPTPTIEEGAGQPSGCSMTGWTCVQRGPCWYKYCTGNGKTIEDNDLRVIRGPEGVLCPKDT